VSSSVSNSPSASETPGYDAFEVVTGVTFETYLVAEGTFEVLEAA
jgi:hypothetical protein